MNMDVAAMFLASSILLSLGIIVLVGAAIIINNLLHRYWQKINLFMYAVDPRVEPIKKMEPEVKPETNPNKLQTQEEINELKTAARARMATANIRSETTEKNQ